MRSTLFSLVALAACAVGCGATDNRGSTSDSKAEGALQSAVEVSESENGDTISVEKGKTVRLSLHGYENSGLSWKVTSTDQIFGHPAPVDGEFVLGDGRDERGGGGYWVFTWKTSSTLLTVQGYVHRVELEYSSDDERSEAPPEKTFAFGVEIKAAAAGAD